MPVYEYKCRSCGREMETMMRLPNLPCACVEGMMKRKFSFTVKMSMPDHFNPSTGTYVRNEQNLVDDFKRASDAETERTGILHNYVPVDPHDREKLGVTDEDLPATFDAADGATREKLAKWL